MSSAWDDERTARLYEEFARKFPMYDDTSRDLVRLANVAEANTIIDLACGTGATAWLKIPVFANNVLAGMPYDQQVAVIDKAYEHVDGTAVETTRWACFVATRI